MVFYTCLLLFVLFNNSLFSNPVNEHKVKTVVIDAGHGGKDPGAIGFSKSYEKDITLSVSLKLGELIKKEFPDVKVIYTRNKDVFVELQERAAIANKHNADLFISIHCNANNDRSAYGTEVYCLGLHRTEANLEVAKRENSVILMEDNYVEKYDGFDPTAPEAHIIFSLFQYAFLNQSISLASKIDHHFHHTIKRKSRGVKQAGFLVLYKTTMPGVLIELGFISNKEEEAFLKSTDGQDKVAMSLLKAFADYKKEMESNGVKTPVATEKTSPSPTPVKEEPKPVVKEEPKPVVKEEPQPLVKETPPAAKETVSPERIPSDNEALPDWIFKVQFYATKTKIPTTDEKLKLVFDWEIEKTETGILRYISGKFFSLKTAEEQMKVLHQIGYTDAFIVPYHKGEKRITMKEYQQLMGQ